MPERTIVYEIKAHLGVISKYENGWSKELNIVSWNGQAPKIDIRDWDANHERMSKGITLHLGEMRRIINAFIGYKNRKVIEEAQLAEEGRRARRKSNMKNNYKENEVNLGEGTFPDAVIDMISDNGELSDSVNDDMQYENGELSEIENSSDESSNNENKEDASIIAESEQNMAEIPEGMSL